MDTIKRTRIGAFGDTTEMFVIAEGFNRMQIAGGSTWTGDDYPRSSLK